MFEMWEKPEARKMLLNRADSHTSGARCVGQPPKNARLDGCKQTTPHSDPNCTTNIDNCQKIRRIRRLAKQRPHCPKKETMPKPDNADEMN